MLMDKGFKTKMTSSIFEEKNKSNNYESNKSQGRANSDMYDQNKSNSSNQEKTVFKRIKEMK